MWDPRSPTSLQHVDLCKTSKKNMALPESHIIPLATVCMAFCLTLYFELSMRRCGSLEELDEVQENYKVFLDWNPAHSFFRDFAKKRF